MKMYHKIKKKLIRIHNAINTDMFSMFFSCFISSKHIQMVYHYINFSASLLLTNVHAVPV